MVGLALITWVLCRVTPYLPSCVDHCACPYSLLCPVSLLEVVRSPQGMARVGTLLGLVPLGEETTDFGFPRRHLTSH